jgi:hypothetical protein
MGGWMEVTHLKVRCLGETGRRIMIRRLEVYKVEDCGRRASECEYFANFESILMYRTFYRGAKEVHSCSFGA